MKLTHSDAAQLFRGLGALLHAGLSLADGVYLLSREESGEKKELLDSLGQAMDRGIPLHTAMEASAAFPEAAVGMIRIGQATGRLEDTLTYLAEFYDERVRTTRQIKNALGYPALILVLMLAVIGVLLVEVLPVFDRVYASLGSSLTGVAGGLLRLGQGLKAALPVLLVLLAAVALLVLAYRFGKSFREKVNALVLRRFGDVSVARKFNNAQFAHALSMGLASGLPLEESLDMARLLLAHIPGAADRCGLCAKCLKEGMDLSQALGEARLLPPAQSRMLSVGLQSGSGDTVMADIARRLSEDAKASLEDVVAKVEPAMVLICSILVGAILLAVMLPLMNIMSTIG